MTLQEKNYNRYIIKLRKQLKNNTVSIISNNCIGGILYHDLGLRFNSPTINTLIYGDEFIEFINNLKSYISCVLTYDISSTTYPIGILAPIDKQAIHIHFLHSTNFEKAKFDWEKRKNRIDYDNIFVIYEHFNNFDNSIIEKFDKINYNKIVFTHKKFKLKSAKYIPACKKEKSFGRITKFKNQFSGKRNLYKCNIVKLLNDITN